MALINLAAATGLSMSWVEPLVLLVKDYSKKEVHHVWIRVQEALGVVAGQRGDRSRNCCINDAVRPLRSMEGVDSP